MDFEQQIQWIDYQIKELEAIKNSMGKDFIGNDEQVNLEALTSIKYDYQKAYNDSIKLSWTECPDRMGW